MKLKINRVILEVFEGAEIQHALLMYLTRRRMSTKLLDRLAVYDIWGHEIDLQAPVSEYKEIRIRFKDTK